MGIGEGVAMGVGVGIVDFDIMPPGTSIDKLVLARTREGVGVTRGVANGELVLI